MAKSRKQGAAKGGRQQAEDAPRKGGILAALRRSPLVGADLDIGRRIEIYSDKRIAEFDENDRELGALLQRKRS